MKDLTLEKIKELGISPRIIPDDKRRDYLEREDDFQSDLEKAKGLGQTISLSFLNIATNETDFVDAFIQADTVVEINPVIDKWLSEEHENDSPEYAVLEVLFRCMSVWFIYQDPNDPLRDEKRNSIIITIAGVVKAIFPDARNVYISAEGVKGDEAVMRLTGVWEKSQGLLN